MLTFQERTEDDPWPEDEAGWRPPARCPDCHGLQTRFVRMEEEMSVYACESCGVEFEIEESG
jgi:hypothetical protein